MDDLLELIRSHWLFILIVTVVASVVGLSATYVLGNEFEASTTVLIRPQKEVGFDANAKAMMNYPLSFSLKAESISETYANIMVSDAVAYQVEDQLRFHERFDPPEEDPFWRAVFTVRDWAKIAVVYTWEFVRYGYVQEKDPYEKAVQDIREGLSAEAMQDTYLFTLTATAGDPQDAADIANTAAQVFVRYSIAARQKEDGTSAGFVRESVELAREEIRATREKIDEFFDETGTSSLEQEMSLKLDALGELESDRTGVDSDLQAIGAELAVLRDQLSGSSEVGRTRESVLKEIQAKLLDRLASREGLTARATALDGSIASFELELSELVDRRPEMERLMLELGAQEENFRMLSREYEESRLAAAREISEIRILHPAVAPVYPEGPIKLFYTLGGTAMGLLLALGVVLGVDFVSHRVRTREDIERALGVPVLASVPHARLPGRAVALIGDTSASPVGPPRRLWELSAGSVTGSE